LNGWRITFSAGPFGGRSCGAAIIGGGVSSAAELSENREGFLTTGRRIVSPADYEGAEAPDADCREGYRSARINVQGSREAFGSEQA